VGSLEKSRPAETFLKQNLTKPAKSLEANDELKKTFSLLPKQTQLAARSSTSRTFSKTKA